MQARHDAKSMEALQHYAPILQANLRATLARQEVGAMAMSHSMSELQNPEPPPKARRDMVRKKIKSQLVAKGMRVTTVKVVEEATRMERAAAILNAKLRSWKVRAIKRAAEGRAKHSSKLDVEKTMSPTPQSKLSQQSKRRVLAEVFSEVDARRDTSDQRLHAAVMQWQRLELHKGCASWRATSKELAQQRRAATKALTWRSTSKSALVELRDGVTIWLRNSEWIKHDTAKWEHTIQVKT